MTSFHLGEKVAVEERHKHSLTESKHAMVFPSSLLFSVQSPTVEVPADVHLPDDALRQTNGGNHVKRVQGSSQKPLQQKYSFNFNGNLLYGSKFGLTFCILAISQSLEHSILDC